MSDRSTSNAFNLLHFLTNYDQDKTFWISLVFFFFHIEWNHIGLKYFVIYIHKKYWQCLNRKEQCWGTLHLKVSCVTQSYLFTLHCYFLQKLLHYCFHKECLLQNDTTIPVNNNWKKKETLHVYLFVLLPTIQWESSFVSSFCSLALIMWLLRGKQKFSVCVCLINREATYLKKINKNTSVFWWK